MVLDKLFQPVRIGNMELSNRIVLAPMGTGLAYEEGFVSEALIRYYVERAKGGASLLITEMSIVDPVGVSHPRVLGSYDDKFIPGLRQLTAAVHAHGGKIALQLAHCGRTASSRFTGTQPVAPSPIPSRLTKEMPRALTIEEIQSLIEQFGKAARRARESGFDAIDLMCSTGMLICQFISPATNQRTDQYGGDLIGRIRFALEAIDCIKRQAGEDFPLICKMTPQDNIEGGTTLEEGKQVARLLEQAGAKALLTFTGWYESPVPMLPMSVPRGSFVPLTAAVKRAVHIPVMANCRINDPVLANEIIARGDADLIAMARALLADPELPAKVQKGALTEVRKCTACCEGCFERVVVRDLPVRCSVNPAAGREGEYRIMPAAEQRRIVIVGGGPGGLEAARVAARRGHQVILYEKSNLLGGMLHLAIRPPYKEELRDLLEYLTSQVVQSGSELRIGEEATAEKIIRQAPHVVILATGAVPAVPRLPGVDGSNIIHAIEVLQDGLNKMPEKAVVIGGGSVGLEVAEYLTTHGRCVTVLEMLSQVGRDIPTSVRWTVLTRLRQAQVAIITQATALEIEADGILYRSADDEVHKVPGKAVLAAGMQPDNRLFVALNNAPFPVMRIGDCLRPGKIGDTLSQAYRVAIDL